MSFNTCQCACHQSTSIDQGWCMFCVSNHQTLAYPQYQNQPVDYSAMTFAVLQEIRDVLKDIKSGIIGNDDEPQKRKRRTKPGKTS